MPFEIIEHGGEAPIWCATDGSSTYYMGQLVATVVASKAVGHNMVPLAVPQGAFDLTNFQIPFGVVVGLNRRTPRSTTVGSSSLNYDTGVTSQADQLARDYTGQEGMFTKGDPQVLIQVAEINEHTVLRGPVCNAALGTAPGVVTASAASATGWTSAGTTGAPDYTTGVANLHTAYCRTGANMGLYRRLTNTTGTAPVSTIGFPYDVAIGDTFCMVPLAQGISLIYIAGPGLYISSALGLATNYFGVIVKKLDLRESGKETADFRFMSIHFDNYRTNA